MVVAGCSGVVVGAAEDGGGATVMGIGDFSGGRVSNGAPPSGAPLVKKIDSNGAPPGGAPLVTFFF